jgi:hypothetical protein
MRLLSAAVKDASADDAICGSIVVLVICRRSDVICCSMPRASMFPCLCLPMKAHCHRVFAISNSVSSHVVSRFTLHAFEYDGP